MNATAHPSREQLSGLVLGTLREEEIEPLAEHVETCPECEATVQELEKTADSFIEQIREPAPVDEYAAEPEFQQALANVVNMKNQFQPGDSETSISDLGTIDQYTLLEKLGEGGMGAVYKARHGKLERIVAVKVLPKGRIADESAVARFEREMKAVGGLSHSNIVQAHDAREAEGQHLLIMEYVDGQDLNELVRCAGPLPVADACEMIRQAALGLQCAHEHGLVHRDIKPSNLMITQTGQIKLLDLGLARFHSEDVPAGREVTAAGQTMGTPDYMAPEQIADTHTVDIRADIYALGCTLYKLLAGRPPFSGPDYRTAFDKQMGHVKHEPPPIGRVRMDVSDELVAVIDRMLAKDPEERFATPEEVSAALEPFAAGCDLPAMLKQAKRIISPDEDSLSEISTEDRSSAIAGTEPQIMATPEPVGKRGRWKWVAVGAALVGILALGVILTLTNRYGTLVVECDDPNVRVAVMQNGEEVEVANAESGWKIRLRSGEYDVELKGGDEQFEIDQDSVVVKRGDEVMVRVTLKRPEVQELEKELTIDLPGGAKMEFVLIPAGEFMMGSPETERQQALDEAIASKNNWAIASVSAEIQHHVRITKPFYLGKHEVTCAQWQAVMGDNSGGKHRTPMNPIGLNWEDTQSFLAKLNMTPKRKGMRFVLPTEAQWEYACRAGTTTAFCFGNDEALLGRYAWYGENSGKRTHPVGHRKPNALGLYDMHGNVWERCADWYTDGYYTISPEDNPIGPSAGSGRHVIRGGGCGYPSWRCRSAHRTGANKEACQGFRVALVLTGKATEPAIKPMSGNLATLEQPKPSTPKSTPPTYEPTQPLSPLALVSNPAKLKGVQSWTIETREPRGTVHCVKFSPDGKLLAGAGDDGVVRIWEPRTGKLARVMVGHKGVIRDIAWSPGGKVLATSSDDLTIRVWNVVSGACVHVLEGYEVPTTQLAWSPDGTKLLTRAGKIIRMWDTNSGKLLFEQGTQGLVTTTNAVWSPDGKGFATGSAEKTVCIWSAADGRLVRQLAGHEDSILVVAWSPDSRLLASGGNDGTIRLWDLRSGELTGTLAAKTRNPRIQAMSWAPDGKMLAAGGCQPLLWTTLDGEPQTLCTIESRFPTLVNIRWARDGRRLIWCRHNSKAGGYQNYLARLRGPARDLHPDATEGVPCIEGHLVSSRNSFDWSPDGNLVAGSWDSTLLLCPPGESSESADFRQVPGHPAIINASWSPSGTRFTIWHSLGGASSVLTFSAETGGKSAFQAVSHLSDAYNTGAWSPNEKLLALWGGAYGVLRICDVATGEERHCFRRVWGPGIWAPDGRMIACRGDKGIQLRDVESGQVLQTQEKAGRHLWAWSPDGKHILSENAEEALVCLWNLDSLQELHTWEAPDNAPQIASVAWNPNRTTLAIDFTGGRGGHTIQIFDCSTGNRLHTATLKRQPHKFPIAWTGDGGKLMFRGDGNVLSFFDPTTKRTETGITLPKGDCVVSPNRQLIAAQYTNFVRLLRVDDGKPQGTLVALRDQQALMLTPDGHYGATPLAEPMLVYVVQTDQGQETLTPEEFSKRYGWKNDPGRVRLLGGGEPEKPSAKSAAKAE